MTRHSPCSAAPPSTPPVRTSIPPWSGRGRTSTTPSSSSAIARSAAVSGFINRRSVNPGDHVQAGQGLLSIQPLDEIYIEANFKETQLADLTIGQEVEISVDAYAGRVVQGRVSGFAPATGAASSMLPPENATGNFVKVVQRIPVRIDLTEPNPARGPAPGRDVGRARGRHQDPADRPGRRQPAPRTRRPFVEVAGGPPMSADALDSDARVSRPRPEAGHQSQ